MKGLLATSADFIDRMANPIHGIDVNESYGLRFAEILEHDPGFLETLAEGKLNAGDVDLLSTSGWLWILALLRATDHRPSDELLDSLWDSTPEPIVHLQVLEVVTNHGRTVKGFAEYEREAGASLHELPDDWLAARLARVVGRGEREDTRAEDYEARLAAARELVILLLQVGNPVSFATARHLLSYEWDGRQSLIETTRSLLGGLDPETLELWFRRLGLAGRQLE